MQSKKALGGMVAVACALLAGSAAATVGDCQNLNGYAYGKPAVTPTADSTWSTVRANSKGFISNRTIGATTSCTIKNVESPKGKGSPAVTSVIVEDSLNITQDECSMYNSMSQIHSKLGNAKVGDAYLINRGLMDKAISLRDTGKLEPTAAAAILTAAGNVDVCILPLLQ